MGSACRCVYGALTALIATSSFGCPGTTSSEESLSRARTRRRLTTSVCGSLTSLHEPLHGARTEIVSGRYRSVSKQRHRSSQLRLSMTGKHEKELLLGAAN